MLAAAPVKGLVRTTIPFDSDWRFLKTDAPGAEKPEFADAAWRALNVPHAWSIEGPFDQKNPAGGAGGFLPAGIGWYRKHFTLSADYAKRGVFVEFDGVMANSEVWINGFRLGKRPYGYVSFRYELTGHVTFGAAVPLHVWERRLEQLKRLGGNAIRTAHNPPAPEFMDEMFDCWTVAKNPYDYHLYFRDWSLTDTRDTVLRDRNHPSIVVYSAGNEIHDTPNAELASGILKGLVDAFHKADPTRPVSQALFRPNVSHDYDNGLADLLDVIGQNYRENEILAAHAAKPTRKILGTENHHERSVWLALRDNPPYSGQFLWSGVDYIGESRLWPNVIAAVDSADNASHEPFQASERHAFQGQCLAIVKASGAGRIAVAASSPGLAAATVNIEAGEFRVGPYGAKGDGKTVDTAAIQRAIDAAAKAGAGTVVFAPGVYLSGSLFLKSSTELRVDAGMEIRGVQDLAAPAPTESISTPLPACWWNTATSIATTTPSASRPAGTPTVCV